MGLVKTPRFESESQEANWLIEHREELATEFMQAAQEGRVRRGTLKHRARLQTALNEALQSKQLVVAPEELKGRSLVAVLREKLASNSAT